ncbi:MAG: protein-L-isoaspartate(D-aspartate) O-methyltransferase [Gammaproteobacteria bacterium]
MRLLAGLLMGLFAINAIADEDFSTERRRMIDEIDDTVQFTSDYIGKSELNADVMTAMGKVPRHEFIPEKFRSYAYFNKPLPIGFGQTISQPYIVALMTDLAEIDQDSIVLEVGTGSGYQAAVLAELVKHVYTIEIVEPLGKRAKEDLQRLGYNNVTVRIGDGYHGWEEHAPFDAILVTAAPEQVPEPLIQQLKPGGRIVIPVGSQAGFQYLKVIEKDVDGEVKTRDVLPVGFVPLTREH